MKVLYIAGVSHSGSTILGSILGELDGFFCAGELCSLEGALRGRLCGCGSYVGICPLWSEVVGQGPARLNLTALELAPRRFRARSLPAAAIAAGLRRRDTARYIDTLRELYARVQEVTRCRVLVDLSKSPTYGYLLGQAADVELYVVHLVRSARATSLSWRLAEEGCDEHPLLTGPIWSLWNATIPLLAGSAAGHCFLRYEDFVARPHAAVRRLVELVGESVELRPPFVGEHEVVLRPNHIVEANPNRFRSGVVAIAPDERWRAERRGMSAAGLVTGLTTWPLEALLYRRPAR